MFGEHFKLKLSGGEVVLALRVAVGIESLLSADALNDRRSGVGRQRMHTGGQHKATADQGAP